MPGTGRHTRTFAPRAETRGDQMCRLSAHQSCNVEDCHIQSNAHERGGSNATAQIQPREPAHLEVAEVSPKALAGDAAAEHTTVVVVVQHAPLALAGINHETPVSGWQQWLVFRIGVSDHTVEQ